MTGKTVDFLEILLSFKTLLIIAITMFLYSAVAIVINFFRPAEVIKKILPITLIAGIALVTAAVSLKVLKPYQWKRLLVFINPKSTTGARAITSSSPRSPSAREDSSGRVCPRYADISFSCPKRAHRLHILHQLRGTGVLRRGDHRELFVVYFITSSAHPNAKDKEGALIAAGVLAMFFTHFVINI
jgi:hypothetical protein